MMQRTNPRAKRWFTAGVAVILTLGLSACVGDTSDDRSPSPDEESRLPPVAEPLGLDELAAYSGVVTLNAGSNCTGSLVDTGVDEAPAYVLTNGHCVGDVGRSAQQTTLEEPWSGTAEFLRADGNLEGTYTAEVTQIAYSTMRGTDTALVRLDHSLGELRALGIRPLPITEAEPAGGTTVVNVGVPVQGLDHDDWVLRKGSCALSAPHTVIEFLWIWHNVWANDCPGIVQGSSGSPLIQTDAAGTPTAIVGMINTTSWGVTAADGGACFINRPCQVRDGVAEMVEETSYAQSVAGIGACFGADGVFTLTPSCPLPVSSMWTESGGGAFRGGDLPDGTGSLPTVSFVGREAGQYRTALIPLGDATGCADPASYAEQSARPLPQASDLGSWDAVGESERVELPETEGWFLFCGVAGEDYAGAASVLFSVDRTPPLFPAGVDIEDLGGGAVVLRPHLNPPELSNVRFAWGPLDQTDCATTDFQDFFIVPLTLEASDLPARYCIYGMDSAGNQTPVEAFEILAP